MKFSRLFKYLKNYRLRDYDFRLVFMICAITIIGILAVGSADKSYQPKQILGFIAGLVLMVIISLIDYNLILKLWWIMYGFSVILLGIVLSPLGYKAMGAQRWINIKAINFRFQPSETVKILLILFFAKFIMVFKDRINDFRILLLAVFLMGVPAFLIFKEPDLSTTIVVCLVFASMLYVGGLSNKITFTFLGISIPLGVLAFLEVLKPNRGLLENIVADYQQTRILAWLHPEDYATEEAYQQLNAIMAIGSGQLSGKGLNNNVVNSVKNGNFISEPQTDFIFTIIGEELGFIGAFAVVLLLICISLECIIVAYKAKDLSGKIIAVGMGALIGFQSFINICVNTGLFPNTGLPLPFVSAGLTSLMSIYMGIGFVLNVRLQSERKYIN